MTDQERLSALVAVWWEAIDSFTHLLEEAGEGVDRLPPHGNEGAQTVRIGHAGERRPHP